MTDLPFAYSTGKDGRVFVAWRGKRVATLTGARARTFLARVSGAQEHARQLEMARVTGNFKRGNERRPGGKT